VKKVKSKAKTKKTFAAFLDGNYWGDPVYSDEVSHDPRDCYDDEALFACVDTSALLDREKHGEENSRG
jgi:hypothetical protein